MSVPVQFSYDGTELNDDMAGDFYWEIVGSIFDGVTTKGTDSSPPSHDGMFARPRRLMRQTLTLRGHIIGDTPSAFYTTLAAQVALFDLKGHGDFVVEFPNGQTYTLDMRPINWDTGLIAVDVQARPTVQLESYEDAVWVVGS